MRYFTLIFLLLFLVGCTNTVMKLSETGILNESRSGYDNSYIISVTPNYTVSFENPMKANKIKVGATWVDKYPDVAALTFELLSPAENEGLVEFLRVNILIYGNETPLGLRASSLSVDSFPEYLTAYVSSDNSVVIPLSYLREMTIAEDVNLRVYAFGDGGRGEAVDFDKLEQYGAPAAKASIIELLGRVDAYLAKKGA